MNESLHSPQRHLIELRMAHADLDQLIDAAGHQATIDELALKRLKKRPLDYFKESFYCDSAVFGGKPATECGLAFYPNDRIVFASDCPFDPEKGTMYTRAWRRSGLVRTSVTVTKPMRGSFSALVIASLRT